ncbi:MAG: 4-phosphoerythronate dehydrogenase [Planctomycetes bacterium]|nr:4-phosphoerythronate dehydrogenase [Planctomycetota bacterium]
MKIIADTNIPFVKECFSSIGDVTLTGGRDITAELVKDADILLVRSITKVNEELLGSSSVKFAATATIGMDHIDRDYLDRSGIGFSSAPGSNANSVGEYVIAALLALGKKHKFVLECKSIGIVGVGNVGSKVADKAAALGMTVVLNDPPLKRQTGDDKYRSLEEIYHCDFVTMHTPLTFDGEDKTFHLVDDKFFGSLKESCFFMNTSRGGVVDTSALKNVLDAKGIAGAVLDVWENEPDIDNELLLKVDLSTPHIAGYSYDGKVAGMIMIYEAACRHFGLEIKHSIDDFLPAPEIPEITIDPSAADEQTIIHDTVQSIYVINRDDFNTREILIVEPEGRGKWFDDLRKNYPVRREFQNTKIIIEDNESKLAKKLSGIGFKI